LKTFFYCFEWEISSWVSFHFQSLISALRAGHLSFQVVSHWQKQKGLLPIAWTTLSFLRGVNSIFWRFHVLFFQVRSSFNSSRCSPLTHSSEPAQSNCCWRRLLAGSPGCCCCCCCRLPPSCWSCCWRPTWQTPACCCCSPRSRAEPPWQTVQSICRGSWRARWRKASWLFPFRVSSGLFSSKASIGFFPLKLRVAFFLLSYVCFFLYSFEWLFSSGLCCWSSLPELFSFFFRNDALFLSFSGLDWLGFWTCIGVLTAGFKKYNYRGVGVVHKDYYWISSFSSGEAWGRLRRPGVWGGWRPS